MYATHANTQKQPGCISITPANDLLQYQGLDNIVKSSSELVIGYCRTSTLVADYTPIVERLSDPPP